MKTLDFILENGIIVVMRRVPFEKLGHITDALYEGGVRTVEVTFDNCGDELDTVKAIEYLKANYSDKMSIGAGTVLNTHQVELAYNAGAEYIISPNTNEAVVKRTKELNLVSIPGAFTASEICKAYELGADIVKLFPAHMLGAEYIKALKAPLEHIKIAAVAGVTLDNIRSFRDAGACAYGISSGILNKKAVQASDYDFIRNMAKQYVEQLKK